MLTRVDPPLDGPVILFQDVIEILHPEFNTEMNYVHTGRNRPIRVYHAIDQRFILGDFFAKLARWYRKTP